MVTTLGFEKFWRNRHQKIPLRNRVYKAQKSWDWNKGKVIESPEKKLPTVFDHNRRQYIPFHQATLEYDLRWRGKE